MSSPRTAAMLLASLVAACTSDTALLTPAQREAVASYVSEEPPSPARRLDVDFGEHVTLLGYNLPAEDWRPGETIRVTWYWKVNAGLNDDWTLFTRIVDPVSKRVLQQDANGTLRWLYGAKHWRAGQYIHDVQQLHLPNDWTGSEADVVVGFRGRAPVRAVTLRTPGASSSGGNVLRVLKAERPPRLDGSLDDAVWGPSHVVSFVETQLGGPAPVAATARMMWDSRYLYVGVEVQDALLFASARARDSHLWEQDCIEIMLDPDGDGRDYFEIIVSPRGVLFDTRHEQPRVPPPFGHVDWDSRARVGVWYRGEIDDPLADAGYSVEIAIPWQAFSLDTRSTSVPAIGDAWRGNVYAIDRLLHQRRASAWVPLGIADFHVPERFGILQFEGATQVMQGETEREGRRRLESSGGGQ